MKHPFPFHSNAVWPPGWMIVVFVAIYGLLEVGLWLIRLAAPNAVGEISAMPEIRNIRIVILVVSAGMYALYRLWRFHPACNQAYAAWLKLSPWTADKPLPLGPIHLVWQDATVIGALTALAQWHAHVDPAWPVAAFAAVYLGGLTLLLAFTRRWSACLLLGFLWPALMLPGVDGAPRVVLATTIVAVIWWGQRMCLRAFPWEFLISSNRPTSSILQVEIRIDSLSGTPATRTPFSVGWPFVALSPKVQCYSIPTLTSISLSALIGWWSFCAIKCLKIEPLPEVILFLALLAAGIRLAIYCSGLTPSFNVWGRIASGRIVVPGFDRVFLTPLAVVLLAIVGGMIVRCSGAWYPATESCVLALIWFMLFSGGPTLRNWILTGQHRFRLPARLNANKQLLRQV